MLTVAAQESTVLMMPTNSMAPVLIESWAMVRGLKQQGCTPGNTTEDMPGWRAVGEGGEGQAACAQEWECERLPPKKKNFTYRCLPRL